MASSPFQVTLAGQLFPASTSKIVCVGRNYAAHAAELNNLIPDSPILFIKPNTSLCSMQGDISIPSDRGSVHYEAEIALLIGNELSDNNKDQVRQSVVGMGMALDLTLRDVQSELKKKGLPWERAKGFDGACPVSSFTKVTDDFWDQDHRFTLMRNGEDQQQGCTADMLVSMEKLVAYSASQFTLLPGDIVLTGTPAGVGPLLSGDALELSLNGKKMAACKVK